jgi:hypothetical protein
MITRRLWLSAAAAIAMTSITGPAIAAEPLEVTVPTRVLGAIVAAEGGAAVVVHVDGALGPADIRVGGAVHSVSASQRDLLDDPRNAPRVGAGVRKILSAARPDLAATFEANHKAWTMTFVRKVLGWNTRLAASPVRGKRIINSLDRAALLAWAGAVVDPKGQPSPPALARAPKDATAATLESYVAYVEALVRSLE